MVLSRWLSVKNLPVNEEVQEMHARSFDWEDPLKEEMTNRFQHSCLKNSMDRGAWRAAVHRVTKSWT